MNPSGSTRDLTDWCSYVTDLSGGPTPREDMDAVKAYYANFSANYDEHYSANLTRGHVLARSDSLSRQFSERARTDVKNLATRSEENYADMIKAIRWAESEHLRRELIDEYHTMKATYDAANDNDEWNAKNYLASARQSTENKAERFKNFEKALIFTHDAETRRSVIDEYIAYATYFSDGSF